MLKSILSFQRRGRDRSWMPAGAAILLGVTVSANAASVIQMGIIVDASSSTDQELPTFRQGVAAAIGALRTDGTVELTLSQFSAEAMVLFGPAILDSEATRQVAVDAALRIDPVLTDIPPFEGGTNIEDGFHDTRVAMEGSPLFTPENLQIINMLTDGNPTSHNHLTFEDINAQRRHERGQMYAKQERDMLVASGFDTISFEALGSLPADIAFLETLTYPGAPFTVAGSPLVFPDPITSRGFILPVATVAGIEDALVAKLDAAGLSVPPLEIVAFGASTQEQTATLTWRAEPGAQYVVEFSMNLANWFRGLPGSTVTAGPGQTQLSFTDRTGLAPMRLYRVVKLAQ